MIQHFDFIYSIVQKTIAYFLIFVCNLFLLQDVGSQECHRECQNLEGPALWMASTMMDTIEKNPLEALQEAVILPEGGVGVTGEEEVI